MSKNEIETTSLFSDIKHLIEASKNNVAVSVNAEMTLLYWNIGRRINNEVLQNERAEYGKKIVATLSRQLHFEYGTGWSEKQLRHCLRFAETFPNIEIVSALRRQLSWTHLKSIIYIEDPLKREFYIEMCKMEKWSTRTLENRMNSMLYVRTAISKNPDKKILSTKLHQSIERAKNRFIPNQESNYGKDD